MKISIDTDIIQRMSNPQPSETEVPKKIHILMIDDDPVMRRLFGGWLTILGYEIIYASDGNEGRETARRIQPDLILMDERMPVMDGIEAATRMKSEDLTKNIPILHFTNEDLSIEAQKLIKDIGVDAYLHKSSELSVIKKVILELLKDKVPTIIPAPKTTPSATN